MRADLKHVRDGLSSSNTDSIVVEIQFLELAFLVFLHIQMYIIMDATDTEKSCTTAIITEKSCTTDH